MGDASDPALQNMVGFVSDQYLTEVPKQRHVSEDISSPVPTAAAAQTNELEVDPDAAKQAIINYWDGDYKLQYNALVAKANGDIDRECSSLCTYSPAGWSVQSMRFGMFIRNAE
jgi:hypothetical protein